jgi:ABC-type tungstate transport system substrate-binding protein
MTTANMANIRRGEFSEATAWAMILILIGIALMVHTVLTTVQNTGVNLER